MPSDKQIAGNRITDDDPLQVAITGTAAVMTDSGTPDQVDVGTSSTEIIAADPDRTWSVNLTVFADGPVFLREDDDATVNDWPAATGEKLVYTSTRALNGIVASGTADVRTWPNGGAS
jgi:hypothetical protein